ncbi:hypothetical protein EDC01DRAFT_631416 [Geopyxis carbonaria]|nr:hypothetical protein EDC01DRAFT_631416 [Geopyxis carbonaria]
MAGNVHSTGRNKALSLHGLTNKLLLPISSSLSTFQATTPSTSSSFLAFLIAHSVSISLCVFVIFSRIPLYHSSSMQKAIYNYQQSRSIVCVLHKKPNLASNSPFPYTIRRSKKLKLRRLKALETISEEEAAPAPTKRVTVLRVGGKVPGTVIKSVEAKVPVEEVKKIKKGGRRLSV